MVFTFFRAIALAAALLLLGGCTAAFLKKGLSGNAEAELHGVSSSRFGPWWISASYSNVPNQEAPIGATAENRTIRSLVSDIVEITVDGSCGDGFVGAFAEQLMGWITALHSFLGWEGTASISVKFGVAPGIHRRHHLLRHGGPPKLSLWFPSAPSCSTEDAESWRISKIAVTVHELSHVIARGTFSDELEDEAFAHFAQVCADYADDGVIDSLPTRLTLSDVEWETLATRSSEAWSSFVRRTRNLPPSASAAVLVTANFRALSYPAPPDRYAKELCDSYAKDRRSIKDSMIIPR